MRDINLCGDDHGGETSVDDVGQLITKIGE